MKRRYRRHRSVSGNRRVKRSGRPGRNRINSMMKFTTIIGIILVAVACGYGTARFVLAPVLGYDTEVLKLDFPSKITSIASTISSGIKAEEKTDEAERYALQFGVFENKAGARELKKQLISEGIEVTIKESEGKYKVISPLIDSKEDALVQLKDLKTNGDKDVFITGID